MIFELEIDRGEALRVSSTTERHERDSYCKTHYAPTERGPLRVTGTNKLVTLPALAKQESECKQRIKRSNQAMR